jgi:hypothetical protein
MHVLKSWKRGLMLLMRGCLLSAPSLFPVEVTQVEHLSVPSSYGYDDEVMFVQLHRHCTLQGRCADVQSVILWSSRCVIAHLCHYCLDF